MRKSHALRRFPSTSIKTSKKSTSARSPGQRHEDLTALPLPLRHRLFNDRDADAEPLGHQQPVQPRGGQPLLTACPLRRLGQERLDARLRTDCHTGRARGVGAFRLDTLSPTYFRTVSLEIPNALATCRRDRPSTSTWWRIACTWSILSILPADPKPGASATRDQVPMWITFRAANGSLSERRAHRRTSTTGSGHPALFEGKRRLVECEARWASIAAIEADVPRG